MSQLSTKKIQMLNHRHELIKESMIFLSSRISQFNHMVNDFDLSGDNPIRLSAEQVTNAYKALAEAIGKQHKALETATNEILDFENN